MRSHTYIKLYLSNIKFIFRNITSHFLKNINTTLDQLLKFENTLYRHSSTKYLNEVYKITYM